MKIRKIEEDKERERAIKKEMERKIGYIYYIYKYLEKEIDREKERESRYYF